MRSAPAELGTGTLSDETRSLVCTNPAELSQHHEIRRVVFVVEQRLFPITDEDERDRQPETVHVLGYHGGEPVGTVRLYPMDRRGEHWRGDRLAVLPAARVHGVGGPLVRFAVATAAARDGRVMTARIQVPNVRFFERLGWEADGEPEVFVGAEHQPMRISLT
jgi:putative N-acetyltransferase (TIGR04045 family)